MRLRAGLAIGVLVVAGGAAGLWLLAPGPLAPPSADPVPAAPTRLKVAPLRTAAWMLSSARPAAAPRDEAVPEPATDGCGPGGESCPADALCVDGGCLSAACEADAGSGASCALVPQRQVGVCCEETCTSLQSDPKNCGHCGGACEGGRDCIAGKCLARSCAGQLAGTACAGGGGGPAACCRDRCVDKGAWDTDLANCGACGHACAPGLVCQTGLCLDAATLKAPSWTCLEESHPCPEGTFCALDACLPKACSGDGDGLLCPAPGGQLGHCCGRVCTDLFEDRENCRACGVHCGPGQICQAGECVVPSP